MKRLILLFLVCSSLVFSQQSSKYAPGQVIVTFKQDVYSEIQNQLLSKSIITSNIEVNKLFSTLKISNLHNDLPPIEL